MRTCCEVNVSLPMWNTGASCACVTARTTQRSSAECRRGPSSDDRGLAPAFNNPGSLADAILPPAACAASGSIREKENPRPTLSARGRRGWRSAQKGGGPPRKRRWRSARNRSRDFGPMWRWLRTATTRYGAFTSCRGSSPAQLARDTSLTLWSGGKPQTKFSK